MPALTVPSLPPPPDDPPAPDPPNPYPRPLRPPRHPPDVVHTHTHFDNNVVPPFHDRMYPLFPPQFPSPPPSSGMFSYLALPLAPTNWQPHVPFIHSNPYPSPQPSQPPQLVHKVWILDCRSCGTFLTNRGMKAVLLLRPNVSLFSTDALPVNCSAYSTNPDAHRPPPCRPSATPSSLRTCECLTQTLCCHTCGAAVGYMIVIPCTRCTSSISATNRATNGHRFVFHSSEITASERHHILNEPGVLPTEHPTLLPPSSPPPLAPAYPAILHPADISTHAQLGGSPPPQAFQPLQTSPPSPGPDYYLSPQMDPPDLDLTSVQSSPQLLPSVHPTSPLRSPRPLVPTPIARNLIPQTLPEGISSEHLPCKLKAGDVLYWHHLSKHGEIPGVQEDSRARAPNWENSFKIFER